MEQGWSRVTFGVESGWGWGGVGWGRSMYFTVSGVSRV